MLARGEHRNVYHVVTETETSIASLAHAIATRMGRTIHIVPGPAPAGGTPRRCPNVSKLRAIGYAPGVSLADGLAQTVPWYVNVAAETRAA